MQTSVETPVNLQEKSDERTQVTVRAAENGSVDVTQKQAPPNGDRTRGPYMSDGALDPREAVISMLQVAIEGALRSLNGRLGYPEITALRVTLSNALGASVGTGHISEGTMPWGLE